MAKKSDVAGDDSGGKKKGKGNLVPAVVIAVGLLGAGYFMSSSGKAKSAAAAPAAAGVASGEAGVAGARTPTTIPEAVKRIEDLTGIKRSPTQVGIFLEKLGLKRLKTSAIPAKCDVELQATFKKTNWSRA